MVIARPAGRAPMALSSSNSDPYMYLDAYRIPEAVPIGNGPRWYGLQSSPLMAPRRGAGHRKGIS